MILKHLLVPLAVSATLLGGSTLRSLEYNDITIENKGGGYLELKTSVWTYNPNKKPAPKQNKGCDYVTSLLGQSKTFQAGETIPLAPGQKYAGTVRLNEYACDGGDAELVPCFLIKDGMGKEVYLVFFPNGPQFVPALSKDVAEITMTGLVFKKPVL